MSQDEWKRPTSVTLTTAELRQLDHLAKLAHCISRSELIRRWIIKEAAKSVQGIQEAQG